MIPSFGVWNMVMESANVFNKFDIMLYFKWPQFICSNPTKQPPALKRVVRSKYTYWYR